MLDDLLDGKKYRCYLCKKNRPHTKFWLLSDDAKIRVKNRPVYLFCIDCDKIRKRKLKNKKACNICGDFYKLIYNNTCKKCIKESGLKKCSKCKEYRLSIFDFYSKNSNFCKPCDNIRRKASYNKKRLQTLSIGDKKVK